jgi:hypothetical protein
VQIHVVSGTRYYLLEQCPCQNFGHRPIPTGGDLIQVQTIDRRNKAVARREHVHVHDGNRNNGAMQCLRVQLANQTEDSFDRRVFGGMNSGSQAKSRALGFAIDNDNRDGNRTGSGFANG